MLNVFEPYLAQLEAHEDLERAIQMRDYHKIDRRYLGLTNPLINDLTAKWRADLGNEARVAVADGLWRTDIYEARLAASKLLTTARIKPDDTDAWRLIASWVPDFDSWAIADHTCSAGSKRLVADPQRVDEIEAWVSSDHMWTRRAALVITLPWTKQNHPKAFEEAIRDRVLGWAAELVPDREWFIQKAIAWWLRELSKHDPARVRNFMESHAAQMKPFAAKEAVRQLP